MEDASYQLEEEVRQQMEHQQIPKSAPIVNHQQIVQGMTGVHKNNILIC